MKSRASWLARAMSKGVQDLPSRGGCSTGLRRQARERPGLEPRMLPEGAGRADGPHLPSSEP